MGVSKGSLEARGVEKELEHRKSSFLCSCMKPKNDPTSSVKSRIELKGLAEIGQNLLPPHPQEQQGQIFRNYSSVFNLHEKHIQT